MSNISIKSLVSSLSGYPSSPTLKNPYRFESCRRNLEAYLAALLVFPYSGHLLIGEAPGHLGCAITGVPFTDERMLKSGSHRFLKAIRPTVSVSGSSVENTAGMVWNHLCECSVLPAFWNAIPFHTCADDEPNRAPKSAEIRSCQVLLTQVIQILAPHTLVAVGKKAEAALKLLGKTRFESVRHPSHGGKPAYISGLASIGISH